MTKNKSKYFDREYEKAKLELMKSNYEVKYSDAPITNKDIINRLVKEQRDKINQEKRIREQERKVYQHSVPGRVEAYLKEKQKGKFVPDAIKRVIRKGRLNALKAITKGHHGGLVSQGDTGYFKKEYVKESKWLG